MAAPTLVAFYIGTTAAFVADEASATSGQGSFVPMNSGATTLNGAIVTIGMIPGSCTEYGISASGATTYLWTLYANGLV